MISDNNHITYSAEDIQRYWKGQLSPQEMHAMEKAALDDPFLADAMEGMCLAMQEHNEKMLNTQLAGMRRQVQARAGGTVRTAPVRSFRWWQVAAAAFVLMVAGYWIFSPGRLAKEGLVQKEDAALSPVVAKDSGGETASSNTVASKPVSDSIEITAGLKSYQAKEPGLFEFNTSTPDKKRKKDLIDTKEKAKQANAQNPPLAEQKKEKQELSMAARSAPPPPVNLDTVRFMGETEVITLQESAVDLTKTADKNKDKEEEPKLQNIIKGVVTDNKNNPLPNVFIRLDNNKNSYTTDPSGNFRIPASDSVVNVSVSLQGYATQNFQLRNTYNGAGSLAENQIKLQSNAEMAANRALTQASDDKKGKARFDNEAKLYKITDQDAQPVNGWLSYQQYLDDNKRKPASNPNLIGEVAVSFNIDKKGQRSDYRIEKSLSADHDAEALRLVREGPSWKLTRGRKSRVTVIVRF